MKKCDIGVYKETVSTPNIDRGTLGIHMTTLFFFRIYGSLLKRVLVQIFQLYVSVRSGPRRRTFLCPAHLLLVITTRPCS